MFDLFRLLENVTLEMFSTREGRKSKHKFGVTKVCKAKEVGKYFVHSKMCVNYLISSLDFRNISLTLSLLDMRTMNGVISWYVLTLQRLFHFIACVLFLSISFFFSYFFVDFTSCLGIE